MTEWLSRVVKYICRLFQIEPYTTNSWIKDTKQRIDNALSRIKYQIDSGSDEVDYRLLNWCLGDIYPDNIELDHETLIQSLHVNKNGLSFSWKHGSLSNWGMKFKEAGCVACLFYMFNGVWMGGRFDWVSTANLHIPFDNINNRCYGWEPRFIDHSKEFAFLIIDPSGRIRTNVIYYKTN